MSTNVRLLIVEDDEAAINEWNKLIERLNAQDPDHFVITHQVAKSLQQSKELIASSDFDASIVDLRLQVEVQGGYHNDDGNEVVNLLIDSEMAAIAIYTGQPEEAVIPEGSNITVISKDDGLAKVGEWLQSQFNLISHIRSVGKIIDQNLAKIFHKSIWPRWKNWMKDPQFTGENSQLLNSALTRHFVSHLHAELLEHNMVGVHQEEWYFVPPISQHVSTGDLVENENGDVEIIITPRCDIATGKCRSIQLALCEDISAEWLRLNHELSVTTSKKNAMSELGNICQHNKKNVLHYIPQMVTNDGHNKGPWFVRFDSIRSEKNTQELLDKLKTNRFASVTPTFLPSLVERLGSFFSRIGTPDISL